MNARNWRLQTLVPLAFALAVAGCQKQAEAPQAPSSRPVKTMVVGGDVAGGMRKFPARIEAAQRADLGFRVPGTVQEINVKEGDLVSKGQVLARLDPTDYQIVVDDRQASFDSAQRNYQRAQQLIVDGNISKMDYDRVEATYKSAEAALATAKQNLDYTQLKAPFPGRIARRHVENFEVVLAKQKIFTLNQVDLLEVKIDLPESVLRSLRMDRENAPEGERVRDLVQAQASFEGVPDRSFDLEFKEIATRADPRTQTFEVTFTMPAPEGVVILPGMTATVTVNLGQVADLKQVAWLPVDAVVADAGLGPQVWVLDPQSMTVSPRKVTTGAMDGDRIQVTSGLSPGEEVVTVGAAYLADGMRVTRLEGGEQAVPRPDDPN